MMASVHGRPRPSPDDQHADGGFATVSYIVCMMLTIMVFVVAINMLLAWYATSVVREAINEGARAGAVKDGDLDDCRAASSNVLDSLLGTWNDGIEVQCTDTGETITAEATGVLPSVIYTFGLTDLDVSSTAVVIKEPRLDEALQEVNDEQTLNP
jgi:hypothetical protein